MNLDIVEPQYKHSNEREISYFYMESRLLRVIPTEKHTVWTHANYPWKEFALIEDAYIEVPLYLGMKILEN